MARPARRAPRLARTVLLASLVVLFSGAPRLHAQGTPGDPAEAPAPAGFSTAAAEGTGTASATTSATTTGPDAEGAVAATLANEPAEPGEASEPDTGSRIPAPMPTPVPAPGPSPASGQPRPRAPKSPADLLKNLPADASAIEIEAALAQGKQLYLVLDTARGVVEIKARGVALDTVPVEATHLLYRKTLFGRHQRPELAVPTVWRVTAPPRDAVREIIAPAELKKWVPEEDRDEAEDAGANTTTGATNGSAPAKDHPDEPIPPSSYEIQLDKGWQLAVLERLPPRHFLSRLLDSAGNGWRSLLGETTPHPPTLAITVEKADAMRIHHLFRVDLPILLTAGASAPSTPAPARAASASAPAPAASRGSGPGPGL